MSSGCEQDVTLFEYAADRLPADERLRAEAHLAQCPACRDQLAALRGLGDELTRLEKAARRDLSEAAARAVQDEAAAILRSQNDAVTHRLESLRLQARKRDRRMFFRRLLIPAAAAAVVVLGLHLAGRLMTDQPEVIPAIKYLYADAADLVDADHSITVSDINRLEPVSRRALDEAMTSPAPDVGRVANLQLVHYITLRAVEPGQAEDIRFLLGLLQEEDRRQQTVVLRRDIWDVLAGLENQACAATEIGWLSNVQKLIRGGRYEDAFQFLSADDATRIQPLTAYAAIRSGRADVARQLLEALVERERGDQRLVDLLWAELEMAHGQFDLATPHVISAAESDSRLWFHAAYLCRYELPDGEKLSGEFFARTGDERVAAYIAQRFGPDLTVAMRNAELLAEDFDGYPAGSVPFSWRLIPTHAGEYEIAHLDGSNVLKFNELGLRGAKLYTGYPGWHNYTLSCDFRVLRCDNAPELQVVVYEHGVDYYALVLAGNEANLVHKRYAASHRPDGARTTLAEPVEAGRWWRVVIKVQNLSRKQTQVMVWIWPREAQQPSEPQIAWTDTAAKREQSLQRGIVAFRVTEAEMAFDNVVVTSNDSTP